MATRCVPATGMAAVCLPSHMPALAVAACTCRRRPRRHVPRVACRHP
jgi:hypothetical protein